MENIDFMHMFNVCLSSDLSPELFAKIYSIDMDAEPIETYTSVSDALTPLLLVHFLLIMKRITSKGLRSDYVERNKYLSVSKSQGAVTYKKTKGSGKITVDSKTGKIKVKKGLKKGSYTIKVKVSAAGNKNYKAATQTISFKITVK